VPERDEYMPGVPCWADLAHADADAAAAFYEGLFGWETQNVIPPEIPAKYLIARLRGGTVAGIGTPAPDGLPAGTWCTYIRVESADEAAERAHAAGGAVLVAAKDVFDAGRSAILADPEGAAFAVWEPRAQRGAQIVNEHGAVNFNTLATRDVERAAAFYGAIFGWELKSFGPGAEMWTLPGYGDELERDNPGLRKMTAEYGVPGFEDVVAQVRLIPEEQVAAPAGWSVTFAVDDADAAAERAQSLGGRVIAPPFDAPWVRLTVLEDPQGAEFLASHFRPPAGVGEPAGGSAVGAGGDD